VLWKANELRTSEEYLNLYSLKGAADQAWIIKVTHDLYVRVLRGEMGLYGIDLHDALEQVFTVRGSAIRDDDKEMQEFLAKLIHVKYDRARPCPLKVGSSLPKIPLYMLRRRDEGGFQKQESLKETSLEAYVEGGEGCVLFAGSWS